MWVVLNVAFNLLRDYLAFYGITPLADWEWGGTQRPQNVLNSMQCFRNFAKIICSRPPGGSAPPPAGNPGSAPSHFVPFFRQS